MNLSDQLRQAVSGSGLTWYRVAQRAGVALPQLSRFLTGKRDLRLETAGKIAAVLGLHLSPGPAEADTPGPTDLERQRWATCR